MLKWKLVKAENDDMPTRPSSDAVNVGSMHDRILESLPPELRKMAKKLLTYVEAKIEIVPENMRVVYGDRTMGSPLPDLLLYFLTKHSQKNPRPWDSELFKKEMGKVPPSILSPGQSFKTTKR